MLADNTDDGHTSFAGVVEIGQAVRQARSEVQQSGGGLSLGTGIAVRSPGTDALEQAQDTAQLRNAIERGDKVHFRSARIHETGVDAVGDQCVKKDFCSGGHSLIMWGHSVVLAWEASQRPCF